MNLTDDEIVLATAARFLFESGKSEEARLLLDCSLTVEEEELFLGMRYTFVLMAPPSAYNILKVDSNERTKEIRNALYATQRRPTLVIANRFDVVLGFPDYSKDVQVELLMFARGSDSPPPVVEAVSARHDAPHMLVTPLDIFPVKQVQPDEQLCFIIMPFAHAFDDVYNHGIKAAVEDVGLVSQRADDIHKPGHILTQIWEALLAARIVVADLTRTNGNVLYELGLAHVLGHQAVLLTQQIADIPFDLKSQRHIEYQPTREGIESLRVELRKALREIL